MTRQLQDQIQKPTEFKYVTKHLGKTVYLSDLVRIAGSNQAFESKYFDIGLVLQDLIANDPSLFIPLDSDIYEMINVGVDAQYEGTGSILLIPGNKGIASPIVEPQIKIKHPTWTQYGLSHKLGGTPSNPKIKIFDETKLVETNIPINVNKTVYPKKIENGTLMEIQDEPNPDYPHNVVRLDSRYKKVYDREAYDSGVNPLGRDSSLAHLGCMSDWSLHRRLSASHWRSRLGSVVSRSADSKQILYERLVKFGARLDDITNQKFNEIPTYARNLRNELNQLTQELRSE